MEQSRLDFFIGIEADTAIPGIRQARRQRQPEFASRCLLPLALVQPHLDLMKLRLAQLLPALGVIIGHNLGAKISGRSGNAGSNGKISCKARCFINPRSCSGKSRLHVFRQREQGAY